MANGNGSKFDLRSILAIAAVLLGSNVGTGVVKGRLSADEIALERKSGAEYAQMWEAVVETNRSVMKSNDECDARLHSCYQRCAAP